MEPMDPTATSNTAPSRPRYTKSSRFSAVVYRTSRFKRRSGKNCSRPKSASVSFSSSFNTLSRMPVRLPCIMDALPGKIQINLKSLPICCFLYTGPDR